ncbi:MAG TPA: hypothetical protein VGJ94_13150 [Syntrophorhabdaceae bacterium]|jgi:hypothetical protein
MNCNDKDLLLYLEGKASEEAVAHIEACGECRDAVDSLSVYRKVLPRYREGKRLIESLEEHMKSFDPRDVRHLPPRIEEMLGIGNTKGAEGGEKKVTPFRRPEKREGLPEEESRSVKLRAAAIPKDLTKPKKKKGTPEGGDKEK